MYTKNYVCTFVHPSLKGVSLQSRSVPCPLLVGRRPGAPREVRVTTVTPLTGTGVTTVTPLTGPGKEWGGRKSILQV